MLVSRPHTGFLIRFHTTPAFLTSPRLPLLPRSDILHLLCFAVYTPNASKGRSSMCLAQTGVRVREPSLFCSHISLFSRSIHRTTLFHLALKATVKTLIRSLQEVTALILFKPFTMKLCLQKGLGDVKHCFGDYFPNHFIRKIYLLIDFFPHCLPQQLPAPLVLV